jgi:hypothetical protein
MRESLPNVGEVLTNSADWQCKCSLRGKRSDPSLRANAPPQAVADLERSGADAHLGRPVCLYLVCRPAAQPWERSRHRGLTR